MKLNCIYLFLFLISINSTFAQGSFEEEPEEKEVETVDVHDRFRNWVLIDNNTFIDSVAIDTTLAGFHVDNLSFKESFSNTSTGNIGSPFTSNLLSNQESFNEFIFVSNIKYLLNQPEDIVWFNTKTPFSELTYRNGQPARRKEENFSAFFSTNVTKDFNFGAEYNTLSTQGMYNAQNVDVRNFKFFTSYVGEKYAIHSAFLYNKALHLESGGLLNADHEYITNPNPESGDFSKPEDIPVEYQDAFSRVQNYNFFLSHSYNIGSITINKPASEELDSLGNVIKDDSFEPISVPVSTIYHTLNASTYRRSYNIDDLTNKYNDAGEIPIYDSIYINPYETMDSTTYTKLSNVFQIKFNEEANSLLRFGLRAYIGNDIKMYMMPDVPIEDEDDNGDPVYTYQYQKETLVTSYFGGQVFKNLGDNFWWNADGRLYFQGYKAGDIHVSGEINSLYRVFKDTAGIYAKGYLDLRTPEFFEENYYSNHFIWNENFKQEKTINLEAGINIPTRRMKLSWQSKTMTDYIYWDQNAMPEQTTDVISAFQISLNKDFTAGPFHSNNKLAYQYSSNQELYPVPDFVAFTSNYLNFYLAKRVLQFQVGVDVRYHTAFYAKAYMPATGQFYLQSDQKIGNYPFMDFFINMHLKRANFYFKLDHFNESFMDQNYFVSKGYPYQPMRIKYGITWRFYD